MATAVKTSNDQRTFKSSNDEFEKYLKRQRSRTTYNGMELNAFSWYKKVLGLS